MTPRLYCFVTAAIFAAVAALHAARIVLGWEAVIGGWSVPRWVSWVGFFVAGFLAWGGFRLGGR